MHHANTCIYAFTCIFIRGLSTNSKYAHAGPTDPSRDYELTDYSHVDDFVNSAIADASKLAPAGSPSTCETAVSS